MGLFSRLKGKVKRGIVMRATLWLTKGLANGKFGPVPQKIWLALEGAKTYTGVGIMILGDAMQSAYSAGICPECPEWGVTVVGVGAFLTYIGLSDAANREASSDREVERTSTGWDVRVTPKLDASSILGKDPRDAGFGTPKD